MSVFVSFPFLSSPCTRYHVFTVLPTLIMFYATNYIPIKKNIPKKKKLLSANCRTVPLVKAKVRCPIEYNESTPSFYMIMRYNALR